jgi:YVTN family beta-propeller protein
VVGSVSLGTDPGLAVMTLAAGDGAVWATTANNSIVRIDPVALKVVATIDDPLQAEWAPNVAVGLGSVWLANAIPAINADPQGGALMRIDEATNKIVSTVPVGRSPEGIAFTANSVWTANHRSDEVEGAPSPHTFSVSRVDLGSSKETRVAVEHRADLFNDWDNFCCGPQGITAAFGSVWVGDTTSNVVYRIDPQTNRVIATIAAPESATTCGDLTADAVAVWVASGCDGTMVWRIDPATNTAAPSAVLSTSPGSVRAGFGSIWTVSQDTLSRIDPATKSVRQNTISGVGPLDIGEGAVWAATGSTVLKIRPK